MLHWLSSSYSSIVTRTVTHCNASWLNSSYSSIDKDSHTLQHASLAELLLLKYSDKDSHTLQHASLAELLLLKYSDKDSHTLQHASLAELYSSIVTSDSHTLQASLAELLVVTHCSMLHWLNSSYSSIVTRTVTHCSMLHWLSSQV